jgi:hypothetical protein
LASAYGRDIDRDRARFFTVIETGPAGKDIARRRSWPAASWLAKKHNRDTGRDAGVIFEDRNDLFLVLVRPRR